MASYDLFLHVMMLGDKTTEKTSLAIRNLLSDLPHTDDLKLTIGVDFYSKTTIYKDRKVKLCIWDISSDPRFQFLIRQYIKSKNAVFLLYNITILSSFERLPALIQDIREHAGNIPIMLVGTEAHLEEQRSVTRDQAIQTAQIHNLSGFIEVSSKTGLNIEKLFEAMTEILFDRYQPISI